MDKTELLEFVKKELAWHEDNIEECTCAEEFGYGPDCWHYLEDEEQDCERIEFLIDKLKNLIKDK